MMPIEVKDLFNITLKIDGILELSTHFSSFPQPQPDGMLTFRNCSNLTFTGQGMVDGLGYDWWIREWNHKNTYGRPHLLQFN
jgi:hypothetical protein